MLEGLKIEVFSMGGGIWLAETYLDEITYAVVSSEAPEYLTIYESYPDDERYLPDDMIVAKHKDELHNFRLGLYRKLLNKLNEKTL